MKIMNNTKALKTTNTIKHHKIATDYIHEEMLETGVFRPPLIVAVIAKVSLTIMTDTYLVHY